MRRVVAFALILGVAGIVPFRSDAAQVGAGAFGGGTKTTTFDGLGLPGSGNPAPLSVDGHFITTDDGLFRYVAVPALCVSNECIGNNTDRGYLDIVLDNLYLRAGAYVSGTFTNWSIRADFFDGADALLGSVNLNNPVSAGPLFGGWEDPAGIARIRFTDLSSNGRIEVLDNLMVEVVIPEPATAFLVAAGLVAMAAARRRAAHR